MDFFSFLKPSSINYVDATVFISPFELRAFVSKSKSNIFKIRSNLIIICHCANTSLIITCFLVWCVYYTLIYRLIYDDIHKRKKNVCKCVCVISNAYANLLDFDFTAAYSQLNFSTIVVWLYARVFTFRSNRNIRKMYKVINPIQDGYMSALKYKHFCRNDIIVSISRLCKKKLFTTSIGLVIYHMMIFYLSFLHFPIKKRWINFMYAPKYLHEFE